jgi:tetratricopeptide (TPR) repeat protein
LYSLEEKLDWFRRGIALAEDPAAVPPAMLAELLLAGRGYVIVNDPHGAVAMNQRAVEISRRLEPEQPALLLDGLFNLAELYLTVLDDADLSRAVVAEAKALAMRSHKAGLDAMPVDRQAWFAAHEGSLAYHQGAYRASKEFSSQSVRLNESLGNRWGTIFSYQALGKACLALGEYAEARRHFLAALDQAQVMSSGWGQSLIGVLNRWLGEAYLRDGQVQQALEHCRQGLQLAANAADRNVVATGLGLAAAIAAQLGRPARAARLAGASKTLYARQSRKPLEDSSLDTLLPGWDSGPERLTIAEAFEAGQAMAAEAGVRYALDDSAD